MHIVWHFSLPSSSPFMMDESKDNTICRVAIIGAQRQRVAKVTALLTSRNNSIISTLEHLAEKDTNTNITDLPKSIPQTVDIEYLPIVATFDSYEDEHGNTIRYLIKLEYHGPNGTLIKGKSLAPFFDAVDTSTDDKKEKDKVNLFSRIPVVAIGCGIETNDDVEKIQSFLETLLSSCAAQFTKKKDIDEDTIKSSGMIIDCIKPNAEYTTMKEENEAFRNMNEEEKKEAISNSTIGPGKMANFVYKIATDTVRQRLTQELKEYEQAQVAKVEAQVEALISNSIEPTQSSTQHIPNPEKTRYACKRCRSVLFGVEDLEDPPHAQSQHNFLKKRHKSGYAKGTCQNHCLAQPLPWMNGCNEMEGRIHCFKCNTKLGHYSWTGAQCSCGTWVTPAIMIPCSKVDEMRPQALTGSSGVMRIGSSSMQMQNLTIE